MPFSETTNRSGIIQKIEDLTATQSATSSSYPIGSKTRDVNIARDEFKSIVMEVSGKWQDDDTNQTDYNIITFDLVSGQDNYAFSTDQTGNQILSVLKIRIKDQNGKWKDIEQIDRTEFDINQYQDITGTPDYFDLTANGAVFYPTPNYNSDEGGELYISRTYTYYEVDDTTKTSGLPATFDAWFCYHPSYFWCLTNLPSLAPGYYKILYGVDGKGGMKSAIQKFYANRNKTHQNQVTSEPIFNI